MKITQTPVSALLLTVALVLAIAVQPISGDKKTDQLSPRPVAERFHTAVEDSISEGLYGKVAARIYRIDGNVLRCPAPDQTCYGEAATFADLAPVLEEAADILQGQSLYLSEKSELFLDTPIRYYLDETIFVVTWKELLDQGVFTFSEVKVKDPSQFRRYLSGGEYAAHKLELTSEMAKDVNAVVAFSGDYYSYRYVGNVVWNGVAYKAHGSYMDICYVDKQGNLIPERNLKFDSVEALQQYVDENDINFSLSFGPILVKDGENICPEEYYLGEVTKRFTRAAICQMDELHYLFGAINMEPHYFRVMTMKDFAKCIAQTNCRNAYALDGGQTATVVMNDAVINEVNYGSQRNISDIIFFATAKPAQE